MNAIEPNTPCLIDTHAHLRARFEISAYLETIDSNFNRVIQPATRSSKRSSHLPGSEIASCARLVEPHRVLLLADTPGCSGIDRLLSSAQHGRWHTEPGAEPGVVAATGGGSRSLIFIAGHQRDTGEGLEVLIPASIEPITDGLPIDEALAAARALGTTPIIPWGFAKWWGRRGRVLRTLIDRSQPGAFLLGDNAGRPRGAPTNPLFARAAARGLATLPGSDPLDLARHVGRGGSFGLVWDQEGGTMSPRLTEMARAEHTPDAEPRSSRFEPARARPMPAFDPARPMTSIRSILAAIRPGIDGFGQRTGVCGAIFDQINLRLGR